MIAKEIEEKIKKMKLKFANERKKMEEKHIKKEEEEEKKKQEEKEKEKKEKIITIDEIKEGEGMKEKREDGEEKKEEKENEENNINNIKEDKKEDDKEKPEKEDKGKGDENIDEDPVNQAYHLYDKNKRRIMALNIKYFFAMTIVTFTKLYWLVLFLATGIMYTSQDLTC